MKNAVDMNGACALSLVSKRKRHSEHRSIPVISNLTNHVTKTRKRDSMNQTGIPTMLSTDQSDAAHPEASASGVTWSAVVAGAFVTAALYLILLALGAGLGLSSVSVWSTASISTSAIGTAAILWLIFADIISSSIGGYMAGRLRTKWTVIHGDEVYFRDTAHGFLSWSVALVVTAALLGTAATAMIGASTATPATGEVRNGSSGSYDYFVDSLLRTSTLGPQGDTAALHREVETIIASSIQHGGLASDDKSYLDSLVAARTGLDQNSADARVSAVYQKTQEAAETGRKATAHTLLWAFIALLIGAFCASFAGTIGGKQRDHVALR